MDADRLRRAVDALIYAPTLAGTPDPSAPSLAAVAAAARVRTGRDPRPAVRPWSRDDLFRRLASFRSATWFAKPAGATPLDAASRGWANVGVDMVECEVSEEGSVCVCVCVFCGKHAGTNVFPLPSLFSPVLRRPHIVPSAARHDGRRAEGGQFVFFRGWPNKNRATHPHTPSLLPQAATNLHARLATSHHPHCLWRDSSCDASLAEFPPLTRSAAAGAYTTRLASITSLDALPPLTDGWRAAAAAAGCGDALEALLQRGPHEGRDDGDAATAPRPPPPPPVPGVAHAVGASALEFDRRAALLAVYGLEAKGVAPAAAAGAGNAPPPRGSLRACDAALACALCGGAVGVWAHVPAAECRSAGGDAGGSAPPSDSPPPAKCSRAAAAALAAPALRSPWRGADATADPNPLDAATVHRRQCPWVAPPRGGRVGWRWVLGLLIPSAAHADDDDDDNTIPSPAAAATDRLRAVLSRAGLAAPGAGVTLASPRQDVLTVAGARE